MLVRRITASLRLPAQSRKLSRPFQFRRLYSSAPISAPHPTSNAAFLAGITTELDRIAPRIDIRADQVDVLESPQDFYETLKKKIRRARKRIYLSTLYIGKSEHELISTIREALLHNGPDLRVSILTDALRGTRETPDPSCASLLAPLVAEFPDQVEVRMYHTPNLTGLRKKYIPKRINEGWGLQHMKLYGTDDEVILSGANLSNDYFTNRQDRYHVFSSKRVTDYFARIHHAVCSLSFLLCPNDGLGGYDLTWPAGNVAPSPLNDPHAYITATQTFLAPLIRPPSTSSPMPSAPLTTSIYPLLSLPPSTLNTELPALHALLNSSLPQQSSYLFTAGYFNPHPQITTSLLSSSTSTITGTILTASPYANGFYNSAGVSGMLPAAYTHLSLRFLSAARKSRPPANVSLREWQRGIVGQPGGWTYHAKGFWLTLPSSPFSSSNGSSIAAESGPAPSGSIPVAGPSVTVIGSSNYTKRSYSLDLEVGAMVVTQDKGLMGRWKAEEENLLRESRVVNEEELRSEERKVKWRIRIAMWIVGIVGGAL